MNAYQAKDKIMTTATLLFGATLDLGGLLMWLVVGWVAGEEASQTKWI